jgi:hypothetical protein
MLGWAAGVVNLGALQTTVYLYPPTGDPAWLFAWRFFVVMGA